MTTPQNDAGHAGPVGLFPPTFEPGLRRGRHPAVPVERPLRRRTTDAAHDRPRIEQGERDSAPTCAACSTTGGRPTRRKMGSRSSSGGTRSADRTTSGRRSTCRRPRRTCTPPSIAPKIASLLRPAPRRHQRRQAADARVPRALLRPLLGPPPRGQRARPSRPRCGSSAPASPPSSATRSRRWTSSTRTTCACASCATRSRPGSTAACRPSSTARFPMPESTFVYYWLKNAGDGRELPPQGHRLRVLPQLRGVQPVGQHALPGHGARWTRTTATRPSAPGSSGRWRTTRTRPTAARSPRSIGS